MKKIFGMITLVTILTLSTVGFAFNATDEITVMSREDGSGTRGAFVELLGVEVKNDAGEKVDMTTEEAVITNSTSVMLAGVAGNETAIGYVSLGSLSDVVKALTVDGAEATKEKIKSGDYKVSRPFNIALSAKASEATQDFVNFILSAEGQKVVEDNGYIAIVDEAAAYSGSAQGKIVVAGSSSITPVMEKLKEAYLALNPSVEIEIQQSDSTTGMQYAIEGICDIGMASRQLKDSEIEKGLAPVVIAMDGIAVIVNNQNTLTELSSEIIRQIFTGEVTSWDQAGAK